MSTPLVGFLKKIDTGTWGQSVCPAGLGHGGQSNCPAGAGTLGSVYLSHWDKCSDPILMYLPVFSLGDDIPSLNRELMQTR